MPRIDHNQLRELGFEIYRALEAPEEIARVVADYQVETNLAGHDSHGCLAIPRFARDVRSGKIIPTAIPEVVREDGPTALINGNRSFGMYSAHTAVKLAGEKGKRFGIGAVGVTNCNHVGALWGFIKSVVDEGMIGLMWCNAGPRGGSMAPFGGMRRVMAGNPIGFGVPGKSRPPLVTDISTATAAGGKVLIALQKGEKIPDHWVLDEAGQPTTDPEAFMTRDLEIFGAMRPFGEHKGYALALFAEVLGGILTGYGPAYRDDYIEGNGTFVIAIDVERFIDLDTFRTEVDGYFKAVKSVPTDPQTDEILIPGEMEYRTRIEREKDGIPFAESTWQTIVDTAASVGLEAPAPLQE
ncbi:MAG: Ldh family oxidoreductase [Lentisphaeria bacterium]|jgi:uncharacterized oxidoreductase|nr:Ldh family oxidoreductase [Lentisphaeria bacterium]